MVEVFRLPRKDMRLRKLWASLEMGAGHAIVPQKVLGSCASVVVGFPKLEEIKGADGYLSMLTDEVMLEKLHALATCSKQLANLSGVDLDGNPNVTKVQELYAALCGIAKDMSEAAVHMVDECLVNKAKAEKDEQSALLDALRAKLGGSTSQPCFPFTAIASMARMCEPRLNTSNPKP